MLAFPDALLNLLIAGSVAIAAPAGTTECDDPLPIDTRVVTREMGLESFVAAHQVGSVCYIWWDGGSSPILEIFGPTWGAELDHNFSSTRDAAAHYAAESPQGAEPLPDAAGAYMVFNPETRTRRVFLEYGGQVYMIVSPEQVPVAVLAKAILGGSERLPRSRAAAPVNDPTSHSPHSRGGVLTAAADPGVLHITGFDPSDSTVAGTVHFTVRFNPSPPLQTSSFEGSFQVRPSEQLPQ